jgi:hypothetical protein
MQLNRLIRSEPVTCFYIYHAQQKQDVTAPKVFYWNTLLRASETGTARREPSGSAGRPWRKAVRQNVAGDAKSRHSAQ